MILFVFFISLQIVDDSGQDDIIIDFGSHGDL